MNCSHDVYINLGDYLIISKTDIMLLMHTYCIETKLA